MLPQMIGYDKYFDDDKVMSFNNSILLYKNKFSEYFFFNLYKN